MEELKQIAQIEKKVIGGNPIVNRYWDSNNVNNIDVYEANNRPENGVKACATIGLSKHDIQLISDGKDLRIELVGACNNSVELFPNIIASAALNIIQNKECNYGDIIDNIISEYVDDTEMAHAYLMAPFLWADLKTVDFNDKWVTWLMVVPISEKEKNYAFTFGCDALENLFEVKRIDIYDLFRESVI